MSEWKECKLGEVVKFGNGKIRPQSKGNIPVYGGNGILDYSDQYNYTNETIVIGRVGAYCGSVFYENRPIWVSDNALSVKAIPGYNARFLYYFLSKLKLNEFAEGSSHPLVTQNLLNSIDVIITDNEIEQTIIADILSSLDDKIDLLNRQNQTLESMAGALFRHYFIDNAQPDWKDGVVSDITEHSKVSVNPQQHSTIMFHHYSIPSFDNSKNPIYEMGTDIQSGKYSIQPYCILFSKLNPHIDKRIWLLLDNVKLNSICSTEFQVLRPKKSEYIYFIYGWLTYEGNYNEIASGVGGTSGSHQRIAPATIFSFNCPLVDVEYIYEYNKQAQPLFEKQINNQKQVRTLTNLRDKLLSKLMSEEIKVK